MKILVVEDNADWREALAMMYCRRLREVNLETKNIPDDCKKCACAKKCVGLEPENNAGFEQREKHVMTAADANQATSQIQLERNDVISGKRKFDLISLDLDIPMAGTGIDILKHATTGNRRVAVLAITLGTDTDALKKRLSRAERDKLDNLRLLVEQQSGGRCEVILKGTGPIDERIKSIEKNWTRLSLMRLVRETDDRNDKVDNTDHLCLHFVLPNEDLPENFPSYVRISSSKNGRLVVEKCIHMEKSNQIPFWPDWPKCNCDNLRDQLGAQLIYLAANRSIQMFCSLQKSNNADRPDTMRSLINWKGNKPKMLLARLIAHRILRDTNLPNHDPLLLNSWYDSIVNLLGNKWRNDGSIDVIKVGEEIFIDISPRTVRRQGGNNRKNADRTDDPRNLISVRKFLANLTPSSEDLVKTHKGAFILKVKATVFLHRSSAIGQQTRSAGTRKLRDDDCVADRYGSKVDFKNWTKTRSAEQ